MSFLRKILRRDKQKETTGAPELKETAKVSEVSRMMPAGRAAVLGVLLGAHVTEKSASLAKSRSYVFRVTARANKPQVRKAVESRFAVHVDSVRMLAARKKARMRGRIKGWKPGFRKAVVRIKQGETIEVQ